MILNRCKNAALMPLLSMVVLMSSVAYANPSCLPMAITSYEVIYCKILERGGGKNLPDFAQFQRNPPRTQALLIKRPAAKFGIVIDEPKADLDIKRVEKNIERSMSDQYSRRTTQQRGRQDYLQRDLSVSRKSVDRELTQRCYLQAKAIVCGETQYVLVDNKHNRELAPNVLNDANSMQLPLFKGSPDDEGGLNIYMTDAYRQYINKMLEIGLGGVTMSYTRFYYTRQALLEHKIDFVVRLEEMFQYLKQDKRYLAVAAGDPPVFNGLGFCMPLDEQLIVCDNTNSNWVYQLDGV